MKEREKYEKEKKMLIKSLEDRVNKVVE